MLFSIDLRFNVSAMPSVSKLDGKHVFAFSIRLCKHSFTVSANRKVDKLSSTHNHFSLHSVRTVSKVVTLRRENFFTLEVVTVLLNIRFINLLRFLETFYLQYENATVTVTLPDARCNETECCKNNYNR